LVLNFVFPKFKFENRHFESIIGYDLYLLKEEMSHLSTHEREQIMILLAQRKSKRKIAKMLWRHISTICSEIRTNSVRGVYSAEKATHKAYVRRHFAKKTLKKIRVNDELEQYIRKKIKDDRSPEMTAWRWNNEHGDLTISTPTIYKYISCPFGYALQEHLYTNRNWRRRRSHSNKKWIIKYRIFVDFRPEKISKLREFAHYEADLIVWPQGTKEVLLVIIEKVSRWKMAVKLPNKKAITVEQVLRRWINILGIKSITFDNGVEFANHYKLWIPTYFSNPYHSREKAQVERWNRDYRRYFPKKTERKKISQMEIDKITEKLNHMPMKVLKFNTPSEVFHTYSNVYFPVSVFTL
jgi:transposase, IS30 family